MASATERLCYFPELQLVEIYHCRCCAMMLKAVKRCGGVGDILRACAIPGGAMALRTRSPARLLALAFCRGAWWPPAFVSSHRRGATNLTPLHRSAVRLPWRLCVNVARVRRLSVVAQGFLWQLNPLALLSCKASRSFLHRQPSAVTTGHWLMLNC